MLHIIFFSCAGTPWEVEGLERNSIYIWRSWWWYVVSQRLKSKMHEHKTASICTIFCVNKLYELNYIYVGICSPTPPLQPIPQNSRNCFHILSYCFRLASFVNCTKMSSSETMVDILVAAAVYTQLWVLYKVIWLSWSAGSQLYYVHMLSLIHIWRCRRSTLCRSRWSPYH